MGIIYALVPCPISQSKIVNRSRKALENKKP